MMNLREFTEAVDQTAGEMEKNELKCFIHNITRKIPEGKRTEFLKLLDNIRKDGNVSDGENRLQAAARKANEQEIEQEMSRLRSMFQRIEDEELCIYADGYEEYSQGYWEDNWVWEYEDPKDICRAYAEGSMLVQRCVNDGFYTDAIKIFDSMMSTEALVQNDWDMFSMGLEELVEEGLLTVDLEKLALYVLYAAYQAEKPEMRAQKLFDYFSVSFFQNISMEQMLSLGGEELTGLSDFWHSWIMLLIGKTGDVAGRLLKEAIIYEKGEDGILETARAAYQSHPSLYLEAIEHFRGTDNSSRQLEAGIEALEKIEKKYKIRGEIALKTAEAAIRLGNTDCVEKCWLEAFRSNSTPVNYLRLVAESEDFAIQQKAAEQIIRSARIGCNTESVSQELQGNSVSEIDKEILKFLIGDFDGSMERCAEVDQALGWSGKYIKCGLPLFLLLLFKRENLGQGCTKMAEIALGFMNFNAESYFEGTKCKAKSSENSTRLLNDRELFWECFNRWKCRYHLTDEQEKVYLSKLERLIDRRVKAILDGKFRNHYESVAALAAALGEVKESRGETGVKEKSLQEYRQIYTRWTSFHAELRKYGMSDTRKRK